ncbi:MAG: hypothetical protein GY854_24690 [Deltaproteobacteria bacterium]|nr:hypothetical protein [Deltaproteobacteria bacterium]
MIDELVSLEELQTLDLEVLEKRKELRAIPENLEAMRSDVAHVGDILEREKNRLEEAVVWREQREKDVALQNELLAKSKAKIQAARNEKELKAGQREVDTIRKNIQEREEEALKMMEAIEQYRAAIKEHNSEFAELEKQLEESEQAGQTRMREMEIEIAKTDAHRNVLVERVPEKTYRLYQRIQKRLGSAVVEAEDGHCTGCNIGILPQMYNEIQRGDKIYQCANCFRILFFKPKVEEEETEE